MPKEYSTLTSSESSANVFCNDITTIPSATAPQITLPCVFLSWIHGALLPSSAVEDPIYIKQTLRRRTPEQNPTRPSLALKVLRYSSAEELGTTVERT